MLIWMRWALAIFAALALWGCKGLAGYDPAVARDLGVSQEGLADAASGGGDLQILPDLTNDSATIDPSLLRQWTPGQELPQPRHLGKMVYLPSDGKLYYFGGIDIWGQVRNQLWRFDGESWEVVCASCDVSERIGHALAATETSLLIYGGVTSELSDPDDQIVYSYTPGGPGWAEHQSPSQPTARHRTLAAFDSQRGVLVVYGGMTASRGAPLDELWEWNAANNSWRQVPKSGEWPSARQDWGSAATYAVPNGPPSMAGKVVFYGGGSTSSASAGGTDDIWAWDGSSWKKLCDQCSGIARQAAAVAYDRRRGSLIVAGGYDINYSGETGEIPGTWRFSGSGKLTIESEISPDARDGAALAHLFDGQGLDLLVLAGGNGISCPAQGDGGAPFNRNCDEVLLYELTP